MDMNVCFFVNQYPKVSHTFIKREILALETLGVNVTRVSVRGTPEKLVDESDIAEAEKTLCIFEDGKKKILADGLKVFLRSPVNFMSAFVKAMVLGFHDSCRFPHAFFYLLEACTLLRICRENKVQHVHAHFGTNSTSVAMLCKFLGGPEYSFTVHGPEEFDKAGPLSLSEKIKHSAFVSAITSYCRAQLFRLCEFNAWDKIKEVHCTVDQDLSSIPTTPIENSNRFLTIGRLCEQKGQMLLLQALAKLKRKGITVQLDVIGDGELRGAIEEYIKAEDLESSVNLLGWQSTPQIVEALDRSSALLLPSFAEGLPVVIMEAYVRARPVLSSYIAGIPELVDESSGWLIPAGSVEDLADTIENIVACSAEELNKLGQCGYEKVIERHDSITEAKKLLSHFQNTSLKGAQAASNATPEAQAQSCVNAVENP